MGIDAPHHRQGPTAGRARRAVLRGQRRGSSGAAGTSPGLSTGPLPRVLGGAAESVALPRALSSARRARQVVRRLCQQVGLSGAVVHEAVLLTSEVVTNAVRHGSGAPHLSVVVSPAGVYVEVQDGSTTLPPLAPQDPPLTSTSGRGLVILQAWADAWGACAQGSGKVVWFELRAT